MTQTTLIDGETGKPMAPFRVHRRIEGYDGSHRVDWTQRVVDAETIDIRKWK